MNICWGNVLKIKLARLKTIFIYFCISTENSGHAPSDQIMWNVANNHLIMADQLVDMPVVEMGQRITFKLGIPAVQVRHKYHVECLFVGLRVENYFQYVHVTL